MKQTRFLKLGKLAFCIAGCWLVFPAQGAAGSPTVTPATKQDVSAPLSAMASATPANAGEQAQQALMAQPTGPAITSSQPDPVAQPLAPTPPAVTVGLNFDGQNDNDTLHLLGVKFVPPDTNGAVGATQFVQIVNVTLAVYSKTTGARVLGPALISSVWKDFGGPCEAGNGGDPVVLYDQLADRWFISQLQFNSNFTSNQECIAVSTSTDATGAYNRYQFDFGSTLPDYPKYAVWPDAYYSSQNMFIPSGGTFSFAGARACALDRASMLAGHPANMICFQTSVASLLPSNLDGSTLPPAGEPNFFVDIADASDLNLFQFHVDFMTSANSTFSAPALVAVAPFSEVCAFAINRACIPQPPTGERLDSLGDRLMFRLAYRNFGDHESLVVNHTVAGGALAGVRWYEIRSPRSAPFVFQQGTVVDPNTSFWMGSIAMDHVGNIALGFSASSKALNPSVFAAVRASTDPLGAMSGPEVLVTGSGVQSQSFNRWGDYSSLAVDPSDDCTLWYTQEYYKTSGSFNWSTRITSFKFNSCAAHGR
jgi:hypothetical protein